MPRANRFIYRIMFGTSSTAATNGRSYSSSPGIDNDGGTGYLRHANDLVSASSATLQPRITSIFWFVIEAKVKSHVVCN
jgi:hypothetical protein